MLGAVTALGAQVELDEDARDAVVTGTDPRRSQSAVVGARQSGTTLRFLLPVLGLAAVLCRLDGAPQLRARPLAPQVEALRALGATVVEDGAAGRPPWVRSGSQHLVVTAICTERPRIGTESMSSPRLRTSWGRSCRVSTYSAREGRKATPVGNQGAEE